MINCRHDSTSAKVSLGNLSHLYFTVYRKCLNTGYYNEKVKNNRNTNMRLYWQSGYFAILSTRNIKPPDFPSRVFFEKP